MFDSLDQTQDLDSTRNEADEWKYEKKIMQ